MRCNIELDFNFVDDLCLACESGSIDRNDLPPATAHTLGPLLELAQISPVLHGAPLGTDWLNLLSFSNILNRTATIGTWYATDDSKGIIGVAQLRDNELAWTDFIFRARRGARNHGFSDHHGAKIIASIGEIYANVIEHSGCVESGYVAYDCADGKFEFSIADRGNGVLQSLRTNPKYSYLQDSGTALTCALEQGTSRHAEPGHGFGFKPLLVGLANISRIVRFRSGNYGRMIVRQADGTIEAQTIQRSICAGLYCSVLCDLL